MIKSKKQMFNLIGVFTLVLMLGTVTYAFFNYTRTGTTNNIRVGKIAFNSNQTDTINLTNVFPISREEAETDTTNTDEAIISITGDTTYPDGVEYLLKTTNVSNTVGSGTNQKTVPISIAVTATSGLGMADDSYFTNRGSTSSVYKLLSDGEVNDDGNIVVGYIAAGQSGINGTITIKAYLDKSRIAISDTYPPDTYSETIGNDVYQVKTGIHDSDKNQCINYLNSLGYDNYLQSGETMDAFCLGTGTLDGNTMQEWIDSEWFSSYELEELIRCNVVEQTEHRVTNSWADGTTSEWVAGRTVFTTNEWNSLQTNGVSFKVKVEANEGVWVDNLDILKNIIATKLKSGYVKSYNNEVIATNSTYLTQDTVNENSNKYDVHYYNGTKAEENANVLFAGYCWQIMRTTDNAGVRIMYNGVANNNKCEITRTNTKGLKGAATTVQDMSTATLFGKSYDYNLSTGEFNIENSNNLPNNWSSSTYNELIGTYTCLSNSNTCSTLYYVGSYYSNQEAYVTQYSIGNTTNLAEIGTSVYNANSNNLAMVGYMFNKEYKSGTDVKNGSYNTTAIWNSNDSVYELSSQAASPAVATPNNSHRYVCDSNCSKVRYYYMTGNINYYVVLENGKLIEDALKEMVNYKTNNNDTDELLNVYNSAIKGYLDNWYKKNLNDYTSYLDNNTIYCNNRKIHFLGGWDSTPGSSSSYLQFIHYNSIPNLSCPNLTDRFSVSNNIAKLDYPVGLISDAEASLVDDEYVKTSKTYWSMSPYIYDYLDGAKERSVIENGFSYYYSVNKVYGVRPVITFKPGTIVSGGIGTYDEPYIVGPLITRNEI